MARAGRAALSEAAAKPPLCRLYLLTPERIEASDFAERLAAALDGGDVAAVQLRLKGASDDAVMRAGEVLMPVCAAREVPFIVNDRPDLAAALGADGVHVGQHDADYASARAQMGKARIVGVTCHDSRDLAIEAAEAGADYVAFGAFFATATKTAKSHADVELVQWWGALIEVPCVVIGGITVQNCAPLVIAGADFLAAVAAVWDAAEGPGAAVAAFNRAIAEALERRIDRGPAS